MTTRTTLQPVRVTVYTRARLATIALSENLVRACVHCNRSKQAMDGDEFVALGQD